MRISCRSWQKLAVYTASIFLFLLSAECAAAQWLKTTEVIKLADTAAKEWGYDLTKFNSPKAHYQYVRKDEIWTVFYDMKPSKRGTVPIGGDFGVIVNDKTKKTRVFPGQ